MHIVPEQEGNVCSGTEGSATEKAWAQLKVTETEAERCFGIAQFHLNSCP